MAVFTPFSADDAQTLLQQYSIGEFVSLAPIAAGIENTNYFLTTSQARFVFTIFERLTAEQLPFYIELMHHLAEKKLAAPAPQILKNGQKFSIFANKPCAIVTCLEGTWEKEPTERHCTLIAEQLAQMHLATQDFPIHQPNLRGLEWWQSTIPTLEPFIPNNLMQLLKEELATQTDFYHSELYQTLPRSAVHADLFRDNVLFTHQGSDIALGGVIDFYFAGVDTWLFDCAVTANDWCIDRSSGAFQPHLLKAFLKAYHRVRPFTQQERSVWSTMTRAAALRFWVSRLWDFYLPRPAQTLTPHDPTHFERIIRSRRLDTSVALSDLLY